MHKHIFHPDDNNCLLTDTNVFMVEESPGFLVTLKLTSKHEVVTEEIIDCYFSSFFFFIYKHNITNIKHINT